MRNETGPDGPQVRSETRAVAIHLMTAAKFRWFVFTMLALAVAVTASSPWGTALAAGPTPQQSFIKVGTIAGDINLAAAAGMPVSSSKTVTENGKTTRYDVVALDCTESITARDPTKVLRDGYPYAKGEVEFYLSSGCQDQGASAQLLREACGFWGCSWGTEVEWDCFPLAGCVVHAGTTVVVDLYRLCANSDSDRWQSRGSFVSLGWVESSQVWLDCGE